MKRLMNSKETPAKCLATPTPGSTWLSISKEDSKQQLETAMRISKMIATTLLSGSILLGSTTWAESDVTYSGFLDHYPDLIQDPDGSGG